MPINDQIMGAILNTASSEQTKETKYPEIQNEISEEEMLKIYNELLNVYQNHNVSYQLACRLSIAMTEAFLSGAVELFIRDED